jgi:hypothetical protein
MWKDDGKPTAITAAGRLAEELRPRSSPPDANGKWEGRDGGARVAPPWTLLPNSLGTLQTRPKAPIQSVFARYWPNQRSAWGCGHRQPRPCCGPLPGHLALATKELGADNPPAHYPPPPPPNGGGVGLAADGRLGGRNRESKNFPQVIDTAIVPRHNQQR